MFRTNRRNGKLGTDYVQVVHEIKGIYRHINRNVRTFTLQGDGAFI